jgi:hypothetical protein
MASLSDILSTAKNLVAVVGSLNKPQQTSTTVTATTLVLVGTGTLVGYSVTVAGSTAGTINNAVTTATAAASNVLVAVPAAVAVAQVNIAFSQGLVIVPGTGQSINVTYCLG